MGTSRVLFAKACDAIGFPSKVGVLKISPCQANAVADCRPRSVTRSLYAYASCCRQPVIWSCPSLRKSSTVVSLVNFA